MKKILICLVALVLCGCSGRSAREEWRELGEERFKQKLKQQEEYKVKTYYSSGDIRTFEMEIEGHQYIIYDGYHSGDMIHSASCPCHDKK